MVPVCLTAACKIFVYPRAFLTFSKKWTQAERNSVRAKKNISIAAWMFNYKKTLDVMPDQGWSMLPVGSKRALYQEYAGDVETYKDLYLPCNKDYFIKTWGANFPEIRLRKHCRFAKCDFCIEMRDPPSTLSAQEQLKC